MACSEEPGHPRYQAGDDEDDVFANGELLYRRYKREHYPDERLLPAAFRFPRPSFNRQKYSAPEDVLHPDCCDGKRYNGYGVLECSSTDLPTPIDGSEDKTFHFKVVHQPCECCYAHSEVWCTSDGVPVDEPSKAVKETFRVRLAQKMKVRLEAGV